MNEASGGDERNFRDKEYLRSNKEKDFWDYNQNPNFTPFGIRKDASSRGFNQSKNIMDNNSNWIEAP